MTTVEVFLPYAQIILSVLLIGAILMQRSEAGLGGAFGGDSFSSGGYARRGSERTFFIATIIIAILFALSSFVTLLI